MSERIDRREQAVRIGVPIHYQDLFRPRNGENGLHFYEDNGYRLGLMEYDSGRGVFSKNEYWCHIGEDRIHPGMAILPVIGYSLPSGGRITIDLALFLNNEAVGYGYDGVTFYIYHNDRQLCRQPIATEDPNRSVTLKGIEVRSGDTIFLKISPNENNLGDEVLIRRFSLTYSELDDESGEETAQSVPEYPFPFMEGFPADRSPWFFTDNSESRAQTRKKTIDLENIRTGDEMTFWDLAMQSDGVNGSCGLYYYATDGSELQEMQYEPVFYNGRYWYNAGSGIAYIDPMQTPDGGVTAPSADRYTVVGFRVPETGRIRYKIDVRRFSIDPLDDYHIYLARGGLSNAVSERFLLTATNPNIAEEIILSVIKGEMLYLVFNSLSSLSDNDHCSYAVAVKYLTVGESSATEPAEVNPIRTPEFTLWEPIRFADLAAESDGTNGDYGLYYFASDGENLLEMQLDAETANGRWWHDDNAGQVYIEPNRYPSMGMAAGCGGKFPVIGFHVPTAGKIRIQFDVIRYTGNGLADCEIFWALNRLENKICDPELLNEKLPRINKSVKCEVETGDMLYFALKSSFPGDDGDTMGFAVSVTYELMR